MRWVGEVRELAGWQRLRAGAQWRSGYTGWVGIWTGARVIQGSGNQWQMMELDIEWLSEARAQQGEICGFTCCDILHDPQCRLACCGGCRAARPQPGVLQ